MRKTIARVVTTVSTLAALAAVVGAGVKWK
jgi:hypothetical protein